jgi:hypothetical protein
MEVGVVGEGAADLIAWAQNASSEDDWGVDDGKPASVAEMTGL